MSNPPDISIPDSVATSDDTFSQVFIRRLLTKLSGIIAIDQAQDATGWAEEWHMLQQIFWALKPTNPVEAVLAARVVDTHHRAMELSKRAVQRGLTNETVLRLYASVNAVTRAFFAALNRLEKRQLRGAPARPQPLPVPLFDTALPAVAASPLNGFTNRAARRAAAALARKSPRISHGVG